MNRSSGRQWLSPAQHSIFELAGRRSAFELACQVYGTRYWDTRRRETSRCQEWTELVTRSRRSERVSANPTSRQNARLATGLAPIARGDRTLFEDFGRERRHEMPSRAGWDSVIDGQFAADAPNGMEE
jgi:hypothetical protein